MSVWSIICIALFRFVVHAGGMPAKEVCDWKKVERYCVAGHSFKEAAKRFGIKENTVKVRACKRDWPTHGRALAHLRKTEAMIPEGKQKFGAKELAESMKELHDEGSFHILKLAHKKALRLRTLPAIETIQDVGTLAKLIKTTSGQDNNNAPQVSINLASIFSPPKEGRGAVVLEAQGGGLRNARGDDFPPVGISEVL